MDGYDGTDPVLECRRLRREYLRGTEVVTALQDVDLQITRGEFVALTGPSGSGKTTLMNLVGCLDSPTSGEVRLGGNRVDRLSGKALVEVRRRSIGFVFQNFYLLPELPAWQNVALPLLFDRRSNREQRAGELLDQVGLTGRRNHLPRELSGGEMQRVSIARALANEPLLILADEPTGKLDTKNGEAVTGLFRELVDAGRTVLVATHDPSLADATDRVITLKDGIIQS